MHFEKPVKRDYIEWARRQHLRLLGWHLTDATFAKVKQAFPSNTDESSVLIKASLIDRLYSTNVFAISVMASHIVMIMTQALPSLDNKILVEQIAKITLGNKSKIFMSFASKYAHFFIDERLPILDPYAAKMLAYHLGYPKAYAAKLSGNYPLFCNTIEGLIAKNNLECTVREFDHYLWLRGLWMEFYRGNRKINSEVLTLFDMSGGDFHLVFGE